LEEALSKLSGAASTSYLSDHFIDVLALLELGLVHLACHCLPAPHRSGVLFSELVLSGSSWEIRIKLHELKAAQREFGFSLQPLVFLNACKTMTNPELLIQGDSFPGGFLRFGASGVIATACDIPDQFAAAFAAQFYKYLCVDKGGRSPTLSEALSKTRRFFINPPYHNPLGLAYGLYARKDLHIEWRPWDDDEEGEFIQ
jgi:CHAT domain-containing protein